MKKDTLIIILLFTILAVLIFNTYHSSKCCCKNEINCLSKDENKKLKMESTNNLNPYKNANLKTEIIVNNDNTYGYQVIYNNNPIVYQPIIPGINGNVGFKSRSCAIKVGKLVVYKIKRNILPPTVTIKELDSLKVL